MWWNVNTNNIRTFQKLLWKCWVQLIIKDLKHSEASHWYLEVQEHCYVLRQAMWTLDIFLLYLPTKMRFLIGGECITCHGSKLTNSLGKQQLEHDHVVLLETAAYLWASRCKANDFFAVFSSFELGGTCITKHLMTGPVGNIEGLRETKLIVSGASH